MSIERTQFTRRRAVAAVAGVGVALPVLAACGDDDSTADDTGSTTDTSSGAGTGGSVSTSGANGTTVATSDVPVGGGTILSDAGVVVTQPEKSTFKAFSSTCTHAGCPVSSVSNGLIICPCHGSTFAIADGSVVQGPARSALASKTVTVSGGEVTVS